MEENSRDKRNAHSLHLKYLQEFPDNVPKFNKLYLPPKVANTNQRKARKKSSAKQPPLLILRIELEEGKQDLEVPRNVNPMKLAERFCRVHGLPAEKVAKLARHIEQNVLALTGQDDFGSGYPGKDDEKGDPDSCDESDSSLCTDLSSECSELSSYCASETGGESSPRITSSFASNMDQINEVSVMKDEEPILRGAQISGKPTPRKQTWISSEAHENEDPVGGTDDAHSHLKKALENDLEGEIAKFKAKLAARSKLTILKEQVKNLEKKTSKIIKQQNLSAKRLKSPTPQKGHKRPGVVVRKSPKKASASAFVVRMQRDVKSRRSNKARNEVLEREKEKVLAQAKPRLSKATSKILAHKPSRKGSVHNSLFERAKLARARKEEAIERQRLKKEEEENAELEKFSFKPKITARAKQLPNRGIVSFKQSLDLREIKKKVRVKLLKQEVEEKRFKECSFAPQINPLSKRMATDRQQAKQYAGLSREPKNFEDGLVARLAEEDVVQRRHKQQASQKAQDELFSYQPSTQNPSLRKPKRTSNAFLESKFVSAHVKNPTPPRPTPATSISLSPAPSPKKPSRAFMFSSPIKDGQYGEYEDVREKLKNLDSSLQTQQSPNFDQVYSFHEKSIFLSPRAAADIERSPVSVAPQHLRALESLASFSP